MTTPTIVGNARNSDESGLRLKLLGGFCLVDSSQVLEHGLAPGRLIAYLALQEQMLPRALVAGALWPDVTDCKAQGSLRSALVRLKGSGRGAIDATATHIGLSRNVAVDLRQASSLAQMLLDGEDAGRQDEWPAALSTLSRDLLPGWYDDWVTEHADRWRQTRVRALESLAGKLNTQGRFAGAASAALAATYAEPLRESARCHLIRVHLAEGNKPDALREFERYRRLLKSELGLEPGPNMMNLVGTIIDS